MIGADYMKQVEKNFMLQMIDLQWREHLMHLDHLRNVIGLRGYGQRDPLNEYKVEAFSLFEGLQVDLRQKVTRWLMTVEFQFEEPPPEPAPGPRGGYVEIHTDPLTGENERFNPATANAALSPQEREALPLTALPPESYENISRNAACPCGSGKKWKHCHGAYV
jgi:preprotein translocase subunit SecA